MNHKESSQKTSRYLLVFLYNFKKKMMIFFQKYAEFFDDIS